MLALVCLGIGSALAGLLVYIFNDFGWWAVIVAVVVAAIMYEPMMRMQSYKSIVDSKSINKE